MQIAGHHVRVPKHVWDPHGAWRHGDPFPVPLPPARPRPSAEAPHYVHQRWGHLRRQNQLVRDIVDTLNRLAAAPNSSSSLPRRAAAP
eukprot:7889560-Lingulodinium_polyedra.AAC.1